MENNKILNLIGDIIKLSKRNIEENPFSSQENLGEIYLNEITGEVDEVKNEYRKNNSIYLEDELGDVFWDYLMVLQGLERDGYIGSIESVFNQGLEKYSERMKILDIKDNDREKSSKLWADIKESQKKVLRVKNENKYNKK